VISTTFVGDSRKRLVQQLMDKFDLCKASGRAHWVSLEGPSGWGKTRVIQEFYGALASAQPQPSYWPTEMIESHRGQDTQIEISRKTVSPHVRHVPDSLPAYMWWGINCASRNGVSSDALAEDWKEFEKHAPYYDDAWLKARGLPARVAGLAGVTVERLARDSAEGLLESALNVTFTPGVSFVRSVVTRTVSGVSATRDRRHRRVSDSMIEPAIDVIDETFATISRLASAALPLVMVIDDIHRIDEGLSLLLEKLLSLHAPVLIVSTAIPGLIEENSFLWSSVEAWWQERLDRVVHTDEMSAQGGLAQLDLDDRMSLVRDYFPHAPASSQSLVAERYTNPLAIELFCRLDRVARSFADDGTLNESIVKQTPMTVHDLYRELWNDLPSTVRATLSVAARSIPSQIDNKWGRSNRWHFELLLRSIKEYFPEEDQRRIFGTDIANEAGFAWTRSITTDLREFVELDGQLVAVHDDQVLGTQDTNDFLNAIANLLVPYAFGSDEDLHLAWLALGLRNAGAKVADDVLMSSAIVLLVHLDQFPRELATKIELAEFVLTESGTVAELTRHVEFELGKALHEAGRLGEAAKLFVRLGDDESSSSNEPMSAYSVALRTATAINLLRIGNAAESLSIFREIVSIDFDAGDEPTAVQRAELHVHFAHALVQNGDHNRAIDVLNALLNDSDRPLSEPRKLSVKDSIARALYSSGRSDEAIALQREILANVSDWFAEDDPFVLSVMNNLGAALHKSDDLEEAVVLLEEVSRRRNIALGPDHPASLVVRNNLGNALKNAGKFDDAERIFEALVADQQRVLGTDHPSYLLAIHNLALVLEAKGERTRALTLFRLILRQRERVLSVDHLDTLIARFTLARALMEDEQFVQANALWSELLPARRRLLGDRHPSTHETWRLYVSSLASERQLMKALKLAEKFVKALRATNGPNHLSTLEARVNTGILLIELGRYADAIGLLADTYRRGQLHFDSEHELVREARKKLMDARQQNSAKRHSTTFGLR